MRNASMSSRHRVFFSAHLYDTAIVRAPAHDEESSYARVVLMNDELALLATGGEGLGSSKRRKCAFNDLVVRSAIRARAYEC